MPKQRDMNPPLDRQLRLGANANFGQKSSPAAASGLILAAAAAHKRYGS